MVRCAASQRLALVSRRLQHLRVGRDVQRRILHEIAGEIPVMGTSEVAAEVASGGPDATLGSLAAHEPSLHKRLRLLQ